MDVMVTLIMMVIAILVIMVIVIAVLVFMVVRAGYDSDNDDYLLSVCWTNGCLCMFMVFDNVFLLIVVI